MASDIRKVRFIVSRPGADRVHHVTPDDVRVVLSRLPPETWERLQAVHFNDRSWGGRRLGHATARRREVALFALAPRVSLSRFIRRGEGSPREYGAKRGRQWPPVAIRRFMLYDVFLHELGHLQVVDEDRRSKRLRFARETRAEEFAAEWRRHLWSQPFSHPDPAHQPPSAEELAALDL